LRTKGFARIGAARKLYEEALEQVLNGERSQAIATLKAARELDPNRKEIAAKLAGLEREQARARANSALTSGKEREEQQRWEHAISAYGSAFQLDPTNLAAAAGAARCCLQNNDARTASTWASRAVELNPGDSEARLLLAQSYKAMNMKARARAELTLLLKKDPDHKEAKALLKAL
jgi:tetratricopeptide (TPR) repeat protein